MTSINNRQQQGYSPATKFAIGATAGAAGGAALGALSRMAHVNSLTAPAKFLVEEAKANNIPNIPNIARAGKSSGPATLGIAAKDITVSLVDTSKGFGYKSEVNSGFIKLPKVNLIFGKAGESAKVVQQRIINNADNMINAVRTAAQEKLPLGKYAGIGAGIGALVFGIIALCIPDKK